MGKLRKVPVTLRAVIQRINRKLAPDNEVLKAARGARMQQEVGDYYIVDFSKNAVTRMDADPEKLARELGVLKDWETLAD